MKLQIDCYPKTEYSVQIDYADEHQNKKIEMADLFLFGCYTLRQLNNLGDNIVGDTLAVLLSSNPLEIIERRQKVPAAIEILTKAKRKSLDAAYAPEWKIEIELFEFTSKLRTNPNVDKLEKEFLSNIPDLELIKYKGDSRKQFILTIPPMWLKMNGFGIFDKTDRYHVLMSTLILHKFLADKHKQNSLFQTNVDAIAACCANAHYAKEIPVDIPSFVNNFMAKL